MLCGLSHLEIWLFPKATTRIFNGFPLFPLCMIGGSLIQLVSQKLRVNRLIDHGQMQRLSGASLDFLIVSAVATIKLSVVLENWMPLLILSVAGLAWGVFMVVFVAPRLLPNAWFECAIAEFGQALGVTATGLMLLRTVDPENKTPAATNFGYKQLFHEPFLGGGICTALALTLVFTIGWMKVLLLSALMFVIWTVISVTLILRRRQ
jgi:ESS family glutamate:Na+ symporter